MQESGKSKKSVLKLASRLQHFLNTGKASKQDLKAIDKNFRQLLSGNGKKVLQLLDELRERAPKAKGRDALDSTCEQWSRWVSDLENENPAGYSSLNLASGDARSALLEASIDADADLARMLLTFSATLANSIRKSSYEIPDAKDISGSAEEIFEAYRTRQKLLARISA